MYDLEARDIWFIWTSPLEGDKRCLVGRNKGDLALDEIIQV